MRDLEYFSEELKIIQNVGIRKLAESVLMCAPHGFWTDASSSSSRYHPPQSGGHRGLLRHVKSMGKFALKLCDVYSCTTLETDAVVTAVLLHDIAKRGVNWGKHTLPNHDLEGLRFIKMVVGRCHLEDTPMLAEICSAVEWHYGKWSKRAVSTQLKRFPEEYSKVMQIVHIADVMSADRDVFRYSLEENLIG